MILCLSKETREGERRVALTPDVVRLLVQKKHTVWVEKGAGEGSFLSDEQYEQSGASVMPRSEMLTQPGLWLGINPPDSSLLATLPRGSAWVGLVLAAMHPGVVKAACDAGLTLISLDAIPRISRAQKMDVLSSQANLAGYKAVLLGAQALGKIFPMLMTAAGTIRPSKVVIMGAGVAGLQAIATAKRLGAVVEVSDIRPETKEQVESLGGRFIELKQDVSVRIEGGYVKGVSEDFLAQQQALIAQHVSQADLVVTTALIPGKKAPVLITQAMVEAMKPGSVVVDMAVEQGGNCALSRLNQTVVHRGVTILGEANLPAHLPLNASDLFARNVLALLELILNSDGLNLNREDEIVAGCLLVEQGKPVHPSLIQP